MKRYLKRNILTSKWIVFTEDGSFHKEFDSLDEAKKELN